MKVVPEQRPAADRVSDSQPSRGGTDRLLAVIRARSLEARIPADACRPTFVTSLAMVPVRAAD